VAELQTSSAMPETTPENTANWHDLTDRLTGKQIAELEEM
jgi:hypothetical protein